MSYDLTIERLIDAPPEVVFDAFGDPDAQTVLYGDETEPTWTVESELGLRVGGPWTIAFGKAGEDPYRETNVFSQVDRPRRIAFDSSMFMIDDRRERRDDRDLRGPGREDAPDDRADGLPSRTGPRRHPGGLVEHDRRPRARGRRQTSRVDLSNAGLEQCLDKMAATFSRRSPRRRLDMRIDMIAGASRERSGSDDL
jgi:uncharacterized protein YndB with AHSA1/START domain